jgi:hypothetical protein
MPEAVEAEASPEPQAHSRKEITETSPHPKGLYHPTRASTHCETDPSPQKIDGDRNEV